MVVSKELLMRRRNLGSPHIATATGAIASFAGNMVAPLKELKCEFTPVQSGSGDPSPINERPISGWTGANIYVSPTTDPQDGNTYAVEFPAAAGTVYGGYVDPVRGVLVATHKAFDLGSVTYSIVDRTSFAFYQGYNAITGAKKVSNNDMSSYMCSTYKTVAGADIYSGASGDYAIGMVDSTIPGIRIRDDRYATADALKTALNGVLVIYELATPIEYPLTPQVIKTLKGVNNVFGDTNGDITVKYWKH